MVLILNQEDNSRISKTSFSFLDIGEFEIREYVRQICTGCSYLATNNIVHLDLKPENIVCTDILDGNINRLKVDITIKPHNL